MIGSLSAHRLVLTGLLLLSFGFSLILFLKTRSRRAGRSSSEPTRDFARDVAHYVWLAALFAMPFCFGGVVWLTLCAN